MSRFFKKKQDAAESNKETLDIKESMKSSDHQRIDLGAGPFNMEREAVNLTKAGEALRRIAERSIEVGKPVSLKEVMQHLSITSNDVMALLKMDQSTAPIMKKRIINYRIQNVGGDSHIHFSY